MHQHSCPWCHFGPLQSPPTAPWKFFCPECFEVWCIVRITDCGPGVHVWNITDVDDSDRDLSLGDAMHRGIDKGVSI